MKRSDAAVSVFLIGLAGFILLESRHLSFGTMRMPQTAFFPIILAVLLLIFSGLLLAKVLIGSESDNGRNRLPAESWPRIGATLATMVGFALVLERAGFFLTTFLLMVLLLRTIEAQRWSKVIGIAVATALIFYVVFGWLLDIPLPAGIFGI
jgi:putative tricarboxylic transport membrane protein